MPEPIPSPTPTRSPAALKLPAPVEPGDDKKEPLKEPAKARTEISGEMSIKHADLQTEGKLKETAYTMPDRGGQITITGVPKEQALSLIQISGDSFAIPDGKNKSFGIGENSWLVNYNAKQERLLFIPTPGNKKALDFRIRTEKGETAIVLDGVK